jgi:hypothetical protein
MPADRAWFERSHAFHFSALGGARIESESTFATPLAVVVEDFLRLGDRSLDFPVVAIRSVTFAVVFFDCKSTPSQSKMIKSNRVTRADLHPRDTADCKGRGFAQAHDKRNVVLSAVASCTFMYARRQKYSAVFLNIPQ